MAALPIFVVCLTLIVECIGVRNVKISPRVAAKKAPLRKFPSEFIFGASTAAYQVEGGWNEDGKSMSIWDTAVHFQKSINHLKDTGDIAADSYHNIDRDVKLMKELKLHAYRFSISWSRLLPTGLPNYVNEAAVRYYDRLIKEMTKHNIEPFVTLYHFDLPQSLQDLGGFTNPSIITWFEDYARVVFRLFGNRVRHWITFNDPYKICMEGYGDDDFPPYVNSKGTAEYVCARNLLLAHANVWHMYDADFRAIQHGYMSIALSSSWYEPFSKSLADNEAANEAIEFELGIFANPIYSEAGDFPYIVKELVAAKSALQGLTRSRLPQFTPQEIDFIRGSADFFSLNTYTTKYVARNETLRKRTKASHSTDIDVEYLLDARWSSSASRWLQSVNWGFYKILVHIKSEYANPPLIVTENGFSTHRGVNDVERVEYIYDYLTAAQDAIDDGVDLQGYFYWSLLDGFQWEAGYRERFGLFEVDFQSSPREVRPRKSALIYREIINSLKIDRSYQARIHQQNEKDETNLQLDFTDFF